MKYQQGLFDDHDHHDQDHHEAPSSEMGFFPFPPQTLIKAFSSASASPSSTLLPCSVSVSDHTTLPSDHNNSFSETLFIPSSDNIKHGSDDQDHNFITTDYIGAGTTQLLSLQRSSPSNLWAWNGMSECMGSKSVIGDEDHDDHEDHNHHDHDHHNRRRHHEELGISSSATKMKKIKGRRKVREPRFCFKTMSEVDVLDDGYKWRKYGQKVVKNTQHPRSYYRCTQDSCRVKKRVERLAEDPRMVITSYEGRHVHSPSHDSEADSQAPSLLSNFFW